MATSKIDNEVFTPTETLNEIKRWLVDVSDHGRLLDSPWTEGAIHGLAFTGKITFSDVDDLIAWSKNYNNNKPQLLETVGDLVEWLETNHSPETLLIVDYDGNTCNLQPGDNLRPWNENDPTSPLAIFI